MNPLYVSFFTPKYAEEAAGLIKSLRQFDLAHEVAGVCDLGSWDRNTSYKATFIRDVMLRHEGRPIVWLDADARVKAIPHLFGELDGVDFAAHWKDQWELLSGTLYFGGTSAAWSLVQAWIAECAVYPEIWDQRNLQAVVGRAKWMKFRILPAAYCQIFDSMAHEGDPVILHRQFSRVVRLGHAAPAE